MTINDYEITKGDNNTILFTDKYGIQYRVDVNNYNVNEHTYIYENTRQTTNAYTTNPGYVYSQNITQDNSIGVTFPESLVQSSSNTPTGKYHTTEQFRSVAADSTEQFMNNLPELIGKVNGNTNTVTTITNNTAPNYTVVSRGWSGGTQPAVELAAANGSSVAVMIDPNRSGSDQQTGLEQPSAELYQALKKNGTVIASIKGSSSVSDIATYTERGAIDNGIPVIVVKNNSLENHTALENFASQTRVDAFLAGEISYDQYVANCKAKGYDPNSVSLLKVTGYKANGEAITEKLNFNEYSAGTVAKPTKSFSVEELKEQYSELSDFAANFQGGGDTLASNLSVVNNSMSELKGKITEHQDLNYTKESDNEASIVGAMYNVTNYYGTVTNLLYGNISAEADAVYGIANAIYQMDGFSSVMAESTLSDGISSLYSTSNPAVAEQLEKLKAASAGLLDTARNAVMANGRYDELTNILGTKAESGHVGKITISSLESAINSIVPVLNNEVDVATGLNASVTDFMSGIGASNVLQGGVWEDVKTNMANYQNLLDANVKASQFLTDTVKTAMGIVTDYIQGASDKIAAVGALSEYGGLAVSLDELDDSKLPELTAALTEMQAKIDETEAKINQMEAAKHMVVDGYTDPETGEFVKTGEHQEPPEAEIQAFRDKLAEYVEIKATLDAYKGVLEGFAPVVQAAQDIINDAVNQVKNMYENPVQDTDGNITFNTDFKLDLSPYSEYIDTSKDYKGLINDYYNKLTQPEGEDPILNPAADTDAGSQEDGNLDKNPGNGSGGGGNNGGNNTGGGNTGGGNKPEPKTTPEVKTEAPEKQTEVETSMPYDPSEGDEEYYPWDGDDEIIIIPEEPDHAVNLPFIYDEEHKPQIINLDAELGNDVPSDNVVIEEPTLENEYMEVAYEKPQPQIVNLSSTSTPIQKEQSKSLRTMGIASGLGVVLGAASLGAHSIIKSKDEENEKEDYGYNK